jgi:dTDP-4-dehydrorhamnose reductase
LPEKRLRILITGGAGLLGLNWAAAVRERHEVWLGTHRQQVTLRGARGVPLPLEQAETLARRLAEIRPDVVVHAAGLTNVDACEADPDAAHCANAGLAASVAEAAAASGARLVHISTDHLFGGERALVAEDEAPAPVNAYARSKLAAERLVAEHCPTALIVRTNFFGWGSGSRQSLSDWVLEALRAGRRLRMFTDAFFTPMLATRLALAVHRLLEAGASGVLHVCGDERISKHEFATRLATAFGLPTTLIESARLADAGLAARRPLDLSLSNGRARGILGGALGGLAEQLAELRAQEQAGLSRELRQATTG